MPPTSDDVPSESAHAATAEPVGRQASTQGGKGCDGTTDTPAGVADGLAPRKTREARDRGGVSPTLVVDSDHADIDTTRRRWDLVVARPDQIFTPQDSARRHAHVLPAFLLGRRQRTAPAHGRKLGPRAAASELLCTAADVVGVQGVDAPASACEGAPAGQPRIGLDTRTQVVVMSLEHVAPRRILIPHDSDHATCLSTVPSQEPHRKVGRNDARRTRQANARRTR